MSSIPQRFMPFLLAAATGELPPRIAYLRLAMEAENAEELAGVLSRAQDGAATIEAQQRLTETAAVGAANPGGWQTVKSILGAISHGPATSRTPAEHVQQLAGMFDQAASLSPEASVALYSLGDAAELAGSTAEVTRYLLQSGAVAPGRQVLEIGCGIGRFLEALSPNVSKVVGTDISPVMVRQAQQRCAGLGNVEARLSSGLDLAEFGDNSFDTVLAIDSFPYIVDAGGSLAASLMGEAARVLRAHGDLVICNYSYRGDLERDRADLLAFAAATGLGPRVLGERPFRLWDGAVFYFSKG